MTRPSQDSADNAHEQTPRTFEVLWAIGTSPHSLGLLGVFCGLWVMVASIIPQIPPPEVVNRIGGGAWQVVRLFMAHDVAHSWVTWLLLTAVVLNSAGVALRHATHRTRGLLFFALACSLAAFAIESVGTHRGEIRLLEGRELQENKFRANKFSFGGTTPVQLPFVLKCVSDSEDWLACDILQPGKDTRTKMFPKRGNGSVSLEGLTITHETELPNLRGDSVFLKKDQFGVRLKSSEVIRVRGDKASNTNQQVIGAITTGRGALLARQEKTKADAPLEIGVPASWPPLAAITRQAEPIGNSWVAHSPRTLILKYEKALVPGISAILLALGMLCFLFCLWQTPRGSLQNAKTLAHPQDGDSQ